MAIVKLCGWELGATWAEPVWGADPNRRNAATGAGVTIDTTTVRSGTYSLKVVPVSGAAHWWGNSTYNIFGGSYLRFYLRVTARPSSTARGILGDANTPSLVNLRLNAAGTIAFYSGSTLIGTSTTALTDTTKWYRIGVRWANGTNVTVLEIDGTAEVTGSPSSWELTNIWGANDTVADTYTAFYDDAALDGAAIPGAGNIVVLRPASLNAAGGWVEGDGAGTAGIAAALATRPPPGLASANETSATNAESPTNSATDDLDLNLDSYTTGGVTGTVNAVQAIVSNGEDIATGIKAGAVLIVSNPTQASEDGGWNYGADAGAHGAEAGNWRTVLGTAQDSPSVTLGTQPVLRVGKRTATTRVVCVDFMGLYVDYTPPAVAAVPYKNPMVQLLAH